MNRWASPEMVEEMEKLERVMPKTEKESLARAIAEAEQNAKSSSPRDFIPGSIIAAALPAMHEFRAALKAKDEEKAQDYFSGLVTAMTMVVAGMIGCRDKDAENRDSLYKMIEVSVGLFDRSGKKADA